MAKATAKTAKQTKAAPEAPAQAAEAPVLRKKDFVERVAKASGAKKAVVRDVAQAVLEVLSESLEEGEKIALPPLGKMRVTRTAMNNGASVLHIKLKRGSADATAVAAQKDEKSAADPLAEGAE
ncbi:HU family DNA-binding protein [Sinirhodobacter sp. WL0062]|uniref:HU family DNA-binding protein n=1 Tax=Rhodobacter flavimaris TaxID=2907145 RepID=A0ABS8YSN3_9RHOB|nr:HU family DNA-binding protein [Sinirhodobacter sp. WL0062]MCE5972473.1 HU family DNA-binding protein [Sinirhodobacter sp. WL0062]